jgi:GNAT superfamily N-acetyltransferase
MDDREHLIEVQRRASLAVASEEVRRELMDNPGIVDLDPGMIARNEVFVAEIDGRTVGFAAIIAHEGNDAEVDGIFVERSYWRRGIGMALLHQLEREARAWNATRLHVVANAEAEAFYAAAGFVTTGERRMPFGPNALLMVKRTASR